MVGVSVTNIAIDHFLQLVLLNATTMRRYWRSVLFLFRMDNYIHHRCNFRPRP